MPTQGPDRGGVLPSSVFFFSDAMGVLETPQRSCSHVKVATISPIFSPSLPFPSLTRLVSKGVARALGHVFVVAVGMLPLPLDLGGGERPERERPPSPRSRASSSRKVLQ